MPKLSGRLSGTGARRRRSKLALAFSAATTVAVLAVAGYLPTAEAADDIDLLRRDGGTPYVFFLIDTSGSMNLDPDNNWVIANGDDEDSKIYQVKEALYNVMKDVDNVNFGLASFNQDRLRVKSKHWLYAAQSSALLETSLGESITYPTAAGEIWNFGRRLDNLTAGTCANPLPLSSNLDRLTRFALLGATGGETTSLWVTDGGTDFRIQASLESGNLGDSEIAVRLQLGKVIVCPTPDIAIDIHLGEPEVVKFTKVHDFLMVESNGTQSSVDRLNCTSDETMDGVWDYSDVQAKNTCGSGSNQPFTGRGWEGNTDSGARTDHETLDRCCVDPGTPGVCIEGTPDSNDICYSLKFPTTTHPLGSELDLGDAIPLNWEVSHRDEFLKRLNPMHPGGEDFGIAPYFKDSPTAEGFLELVDTKRRPLIPFGNSPLGRAINDFRCWYLGGGAKCKGPAFDPGWEALFRDNDLEYGCRVPYLIIISDGEDNSKGENPSADTANLFSKGGVRTFAFTFETTAQLSSIVSNGRGDLIEVANGSELAAKLREVIGFIQEETRTFASAAVPSVQATVDDKIYFTNFTPLNDSGLWDGHVHSFLRPLPLDDLTGRPDTDDPNHLWDAAEVMLAQTPDPVVGDTSETPLQIGEGLDMRRVYYAMQPDLTDSDIATWPDNRRYFDRIVAFDSSSPAPGPGVPAVGEEDLWSGFGLSFDPDNPVSVQETRVEANGIIERTLIEKTYEQFNDDGESLGFLNYILGDIFHSDPLVIGGPVSPQYFVEDAEETFDADGNQQGTGYREFFLNHQNRRKIIVAGANDGMLHVWDAGKATVVEEEDQFGILRRDVKFDNGSGRELFAYIPRSVLPTVRQLADDPVSHQWSVDGSIASADVFIDVINTGTPTVSERSWRTVMIGGLREGGSAYYALDVTHPDHLKEDSVGPVGAGLEEQQIDIMVPTDQGVIPDCHNSTGGNCDPYLKYGSPLWEFSDQLWDPVGEEYVDLDEDGNGLRDLGETWSTPDIGRIRVVENGELVNKYVAVFGGGLDPLKAAGLDSRGNVIRGQGAYIYIVDIETAQVLYKRPVIGSVPSDPAAVDTDQDGYLDRIYVGTTEGFMYRVDLFDPNQTGDARYPALTTEMVRELDGPLHSTTRIETQRGGTPAWDPVAIFDADGRPIYFAPSVLFVAELGRYALGFGTGDRDALGFKSDLAGRFYTFVDDSDLDSVSGDLPLDESFFEQIDRGEGANTDQLTVGTPGTRGWFMVLDLEERLISQPFGLAGVTFFATFDPQVVNETCEVGPGCNQNPQCSLSGNSRIYLVNTLNANPFLQTVDDLPTRFIEVNGFVTEPFTEQGLTKNQSDADNQEIPGDVLSEEEIEVMQSLQELFPENCKFINKHIRITLSAADTRLQRLAAVPVCVIEKNWKEIGE